MYSIWAIVRINLRFTQRKLFSRSLSELFKIDHMLNIGSNENSQGSEADSLWLKTREHIVQIVRLAIYNFEIIGKTTPILKSLTSEVHVLMVFSSSNTYNRDTIAVQRFYWAFLMTLPLICGQLDVSALSFSLVFPFSLVTQSMINWQGSSRYWDQYHNS